MIHEVPTYLSLSCWKTDYVILMCHLCITLDTFFSELEYRSHDDKNTQSLVSFIKNIYVEKNNTFNV